MECAGDIAACVDLSALQVTRYLGGKTAAASYTFDDGNVSSNKIADIFEEHGYQVTFFIITDTVPHVTGWPYWKRLADRGHEIGNHSKTHSISLSDPELSETTLDAEINLAQQTIENELGIRPVSYAFPWHAFNEISMDVARASHAFVRRTGLNEEGYRYAMFDQEHTATLDDALLEVNQQLTEAVNAGGWFVAGGHGVDSDGWSPVTSQFLRDHLAHARQYTSRLWIDTFASVSRYRLCRQQAAPRTTLASSRQVKIQLEGNFDPEICNETLTLRLPLIATTSDTPKLIGVDGSPIAVTVSGDALLFDLLPGESATLEFEPCVKPEPMLLSTY